MTLHFLSLRKTTLITFVLFTLIIFLINVIPVAAKGADVTPPVIQSVDLSVTTAKPGDVVEVIIRATDSESGFPFVSTISSDSFAFINIQHPDVTFGETDTEILAYDSVAEVFLIRLTIPDNARNGEYLTRVSIHDRYGNSTTQEYADITLSITGGSDDFTPPFVESLVFSPNVVEPGDTVTIKVVAYDTDSGLPNPYKISQVGFHDAQTGGQSQIYGDYCIILNYDELKGEFNGSFVVSERAYTGVYIPTVFITDKIGNDCRQRFPDQTITVNAGVTDKAPPVVESVEYSSNIVQAKDVITVSVKASDAGSGVSETFATVSFEHKIHREFQNMELAQGAYLKFDKESGKFVGDFRIPVNIPAGDYYPCIYMKDNSENYLGDYFKDAIITVLPVIDYSEEPVPLGGTFDPMAGLTARSSYEGDITDKVDYSGEIDTSKVGLNLFKYTVKGKDGDIYEDFRWVMVNDEYYTVTDGTLFTNQEIEVFVSDETGESIVLTNDGVTQRVDEETVTITDEGLYTISLEENIDMMPARSFLAMVAIGSGSSVQGRLRVFIDKSSVSVWGVVDGGEYKGSLTPGTEEPCIATLNGVAFRIGETISKAGKYVLEMIDRAGNVQIVKFTVLAASGNFSTSVNDISEEASSFESADISNDSQDANNIDDRSAGSISDPDNSADENTLSSRRSLSDKPTGSRIVDVRILVVAAAVIICTAAVFFLIRFKRLSK